MRGGNVDLSPTPNLSLGCCCPVGSRDSNLKRGTVQVKGQDDDDGRSFRFGFSGDDMLLQGRKTQRRRRRRG